MTHATCTGQRVVSAEGARIGFVTCLTCGAAIVLDPADDFDPISRHTHWHLVNDDQVVTAGGS